MDNDSFKLAYIKKYSNTFPSTQMQFCRFWNNASKNIQYKTLQRNILLLEKPYKVMMLLMPHFDSDLLSCSYTNIVALQIKLLIW